jgi:hypothetical protein
LPNGCDRAGQTGQFSRRCVPFQDSLAHGFIKNLIDLSDLNEGGVFIFIQDRASDPFDQGLYCGFGPLIPFPSF